MPRTKEFDPEEVLDQAMELFWEQGFEATSAQDLVDRTGLSRSSLYNTFGSKQELYLQALDHYRRQGTTGGEGLLDQFGSARAAIRHLLGEGIPRQGENRGCFLANAAVERAHCDDETHERACESLARMHEVFRILVERGQAQGEFSQEREAEAMAHFLANTYFGMQTMAKLDLPMSVFEDVVEGAVRALE